MKYGMMFEQGEILIVPFPFTDLSGVKQRPVLVISNNDYNKNTNDIVTCGITSNLKDSDYSVLIDNSDLIEGSIPVKSRIKVDKLFTLEQSIIKKRVGKVDQRIFDKVKNAIMQLI